MRGVLLRRRLGRQPRQDALHMSMTHVSLTEIDFVGIKHFFPIRISGRAPHESNVDPIPREPLQSSFLLHRQRERSRNLSSLNELRERWKVCLHDVSETVKARVSPCVKKELFITGPPMGPQKLRRIISVLLGKQSISARSAKTDGEGREEGITHRPSTWLR